jgi:hypothetical protein
MNQNALPAKTPYRYRDHMNGRHTAPFKTAHRIQAAFAAIKSRLLRGTHHGNEERFLVKRDGRCPVGRQGIVGPDTSALARYSPTDGANAHPEWVKNQFPTYIGPHAGHEATLLREFTHGGHVVRIITTYRVEVDRHPIRAHLSVDEDVQLAAADSVQSCWVGRSQHKDCATARPRSCSNT